ncbi:MAG: adenylate/guanylate cyclase domain-containing protein [Alphaproteobacteria bacterium]|jgi:adenylate cyclase|nr:adenylate/guanylate cyclase domain-containing protein [Alphaproteobacteria bacterium]
MADSRATDDAAATADDGAAEMTRDLLQEALEADKREGLRLAVRARWVALAIIAVFLVFLNPAWEVLYYEALLVGFAAIGWAQIRIGRVGLSRAELALLFCDLALMTFTLIVPNPFMDFEWPVAMQYRFDNFIYFFVLLAGATMAYSWRTVFAVGTWTSGLWIAAMIWALLQPEGLPEASAALRSALAGQPEVLEFLDPNNVRVPARIQEIVVFLIVAGTLALAGRRTNRLLVRQAEVARERANLARYFPPTIVDRLADLDQPLGTVRDQKVAVLFADIVGFTKIAERQTAEATVAMLREFHALMERAVFDHDGTLDKFLGDGLMATFGTPDPGAHDAGNAVRCGRAMLAVVEDWNRQRREAGAEPIRLSVGIHYGAVVLGDIGSARRLEFAVLGDAVNVASRLEALTRNLDVHMVLSGDLVAAARREHNGQDEDLISDLNDCGPQALRGREDPIEVWTL